MKYQSSARLPRLWPSYAVLVASMALCVVAYAYVSATVRDEERGRFDAAMRLLKGGLLERIERYADVLVVARAHVDASPPATAESWRKFVESMELRTRFPGTRALGYLERVTPEELPAHVARMRAGGFPDYHIRPLGDRKDYFPLVYSEPPPAILLPGEGPADQRGLGTDMMADAERGSAMAAAADNNAPQATGKVALLLEAGKGTRSGFLMFVPVYRPGASLATVEEKRAALVGYVYAPFRTGTLIRELVDSTRDAALIDFQIFDGPVRAGNELFDSRSLAIVPANPNEIPATQPAAGTAPLLGNADAERTTLQAAGRNWTILATPSPALTRTADHSLPWLVLAGGSLVSWLLFGVSWLQIRARSLSERAAADLAASQARAQASELRYRLKIEQSPLAVQTLAPDGTTTHVNDAWEQLWGIGLAELGGYNMLEDAELERKGVLPLIRRAFAGEAVTIGPIFYDAGELPTGAHPRSRWVRSVLYPVKDPQTGAISELVLMHEDFTLRKEAEAELRRAKEAAEAANHAKDQFLAVLSHELRNPLSPVLSMIDLLSGGGVPADRAAEAIEVIRRNVELEARLIDDLLDVTRISRGKLHLDREMVDAHLLLEHALEICRADAQAKGLRVVTELQARERVVSADPARLQQIFWNLIKNAVKFTPEGGTITIRTSNVVEASDGGSDIQIDVADTGIGVPAEKLPRIFDAFVQADGSITRRFGGLGLGLTITRALVEAHGGTIVAASEGPSRGTTFTLRFPAFSETAVPAAAPRVKGSVPSEGARTARLLLIEDQPDARRGLQLLLEREGYEVRTAATAAEALAAAAEFRFDLVVSDIGLPDLSGLELLPRLRALRPAPAIALTGFGMEQDVQRATEAGFNVHITKPVSLERLREAIGDLLSRPGAAGAGA